jgi:glycerophosphoryl diester phosphodiesterase
MDPRRPKGAPPWVLGHRGARREAPENTLLAFEKAIDAGANGVELDVRLSADGEVVICHDPTLADLTGERELRPVACLTAAELSRVELGAGQGVPRLAELLGFAEGRMGMVNVELKSDAVCVSRLVATVAEVCRAAARGPGSPTLVFSSFSLRALWYARHHRLPGPLAWLLHPRSLWSRRAPLHSVLGVTGIHPQVGRLDRGSIDAWHASGAYVATWTANHRDELRRGVDLGVDGVITDAPSDVVGWL